MEHKIHVEFVANLLENSLEFTERNVSRFIQISSHKELFVGGQVLPQGNELIEVESLGGGRARTEEFKHETHGRFLETSIIEIQKCHRQFSSRDSTQVVDVHSVECGTQLGLETLFAR